MAYHQDYIPRDKYEFENWAEEFFSVATRNVGKLGITEKLVKDLENQVVSYGGDLKNEKKLIDQKRQQVSKTQIDRKELEKCSRDLAQMIKNNPEYTPQVGKEFDIVGAEKQVDTDNAKPTLQAKKVPHGWEFKFGLNSYFSGVNIYRKRPIEEKFTFLATDTRSPYVDNEEMVNGTQYCAYFILGDTEIGQQSDEVSIRV